MTTKLYLHSVDQTSLGTLPQTTQEGTYSTHLMNSGSDAATKNHAMNTSIGTSQTSIVCTSKADVLHHLYYIAKWVSKPLNQTSIAANTWTFNIGVASSSASAKWGHGMEPEIYVWRPSTQAVVGWITQNVIPTGLADVSAINTEKAENGTVSGSAVTCHVGDVIVCELWVDLTQSASTSFTDTIYFDGTTETTTTNTTVSNHAAFLSTPENITFSTIYTIGISETSSGTVTEAVKKNAIKKSIVETITPSEAVKKKAIPKAIVETTSISELLLSKKIVITSTPYSLLVGTGQVPITNTVTTWYTMSDAVSDSWTPEANAQCTYRTAGTFSNLWYNVITNGKAQTIATTLRKNAANGNQTISIGSTATGTFTDSTHIDSIIAGDKIDLQFPFTAAGTFTLAIRAITFVPTNKTLTITRTGKDNFTTFSTASQTSYIRSTGDNHGANTNESDSQIKVSKPGTFQNCQVNNNVNTSTNSATLQSRVNGVNGNIVVTIAGGSTGVHEDTTHIDTITANLYNYSFVTGTSTVNIEVDEVYIDFVSTNGDSIHTAGADNTLFQNASLTQYYGISNGIITITTESQTQTKLNAAYIFSYLEVNIDSNTTTGGSSVATLRANAGNTALTVSTTFGQSGLFIDSTHTYAAISTDLINHQYVTGTGVGTHVAIAGITVHTNIPVNKQNIISIAESSLAVSEAVAAVKSATHLFIRTISESLGAITDPIKKKATKTPITTTLTISDPVKKKAILRIGQPSGFTSNFTSGFFPPDWIPVTESVAKTKTLFRTVTEPLGTITDPVKKKAIISRTNALGSVTDSVVKLRIAIRSIMDTITVSDKVKKKAILKAIVQALGSITDSLASVRLFRHNISDTSSGVVTETIKKKTIKTITQALGLVTEVIKKKRTHTITEVLGSITDPVKKKSIPKTIVEASLTDTESVRIKAIKAIAQNLVVSEIITRINHHTRTVTNALGSITENVTKKAILKTIAEGLGLVTEVLVVSKTGSHFFARSIVEMIGNVTESVKKKAVLKVIAESDGTPTESIGKKVVLKPIIDAVGNIMDSIKRIAVKNPIEFVNTIDLVVKKKVILRTIVETFGAVTDSLASLKVKPRTISDTITIGADRVVKKAIPAITEMITVSENVTKKLSTNIIAPDVDVTEVVVRFKVFIRNIIEPLIEISDFINLLKGGSTGLRILRHIGAAGIHRHRKGRELG